MASPRGRRCKAEPDPAIRASANDRWEIDRSVVQRYTKHLGRLDELGWSEKHHADERAPEGIEIGGVRCGSDLWDAGLRAGDVLHSVNGRPVHGYPQALLAYTALRDEQSFVVEVTRKGKKRLLHYQIVG